MYADLRTRVHNFWDRGLLGMALHPDFPADPRPYVLYAYDAVPGGLIDDVRVYNRALTPTEIQNDMNTPVN
ncbi:hypothetical protein [Nonomuraea sp. NPDC050643]|uniref:hypothetical protein n=1 Tax=Nonomuraea sp. NPDC050643 TaxID=3155660 RepID=UPI0033C8AED1